MTELINPFNKDGSLNLDPERKAKVFEIAKHLKKSCYMLTIAYQQEQWLVVCNVVIDGILYQSANAIDAFNAKDHADLFVSAFSNVLKDLESNKKSIITLQ